MISIFNGRSRRLGEGGAASVYAQVDVGMRKHLHLFVDRLVRVVFRAHDGIRFVSRFAVDLALAVRAKMIQDIFPNSPVDALLDQLRSVRGRERTDGIIR